MKKADKSAENAKKLQKILKIKFRKPERLVGALTHSSLQISGQDCPYERLEFFGDAVLNFVICEELFLRFPKANEGTLSRLRSTLVSRKILAKIAKKLLIHRFVLISEFHQNGKLFQNLKLLADTLEAIVGAIYLDRGFNTVCKFVSENWDSYFDEKKIRELDPNPKSTLQEMVQKIFKMLPVYIIKPMRNGFRAQAIIKKGLSANGTGLSKQEAEVEAAQNLLRKLKTKKVYSRFWKRDSKSVMPVSANPSPGL